MRNERRPFRGWFLVAVGFLVYGLGMAPAYYSWGFLAPDLVDDLGLTREQIGNSFGLFTLTFALVSPLAAMALARFGIRVVVSAGSVVAALGFWWTSVAASAQEISVAFAAVGGIGVGFSTLLPAQVLPVRWFRRYRARAMAVILLGAAVFGALIPSFDDWILQTHDWRSVWKYIAVTSSVVALLAAAFLRDNPEDLGQLPDGEALDTQKIDPAPGPPAASPTLPPQPDLTTLQAILTPQFVVVAFACLANTVPWRVFTAHGRLHFEDLGFASAVAAAILGVRVGVSAIGRLSGSASDFIDARFVLAASLALSATGLAGLTFTTTPTAAYAWIVLLGFGYGVGLTNEPLVFARMFGTRAFVGTNGLRIAITGLFGWLGPRWAGAAADRSDSYTSSFLALTALCLLGAVAILMARPPQVPRER